MSEAVLLSIAPRWCELIASGKKTVEVRKTKPKIETPFKCYIYMCKDKNPYSHFYENENGCIYSQGKKWSALTGGKVIGEFVCDSVGKAWLRIDLYGVICWLTSWVKEQDCLTGQELSEYAGKRDTLFGWHISDLVIYDEPKELSEFKKTHRDCWYAELGLAKRDCPECKNKACFVSRPPQSWCYVEEVYE